MHRVLYVQILFVIGLFGCDPNWGKKACDPNLPPGVPGCCPDETKAPGTRGGPCRDDDPACDSGICYAGTCHPCGGPGETCCKPSGFYDCDPGVECDNSSDVAFPTCLGCGSIGGACCPSSGDPCPNGGTCNNGTCEAAIDPSCWSGNMAVTVTLVDGMCGYQTFLLWTNTIAEAEACGQQLLSVAQSDPTIVQPVEVGPVGALPTKGNVCQTSTATNVSTNKTLWHFSPTQLQACKDWHCDTCTWATGLCPP